MQITTVGNYSITIGWLLALLVLVIAIVLLILSMIDLRIGIMLAALALARLV